MFHISFLPILTLLWIGNLDDTNNEIFPVFTVVSVHSGLKNNKTHAGDSLFNMKVLISSHNTPHVFRNDFMEIWYLRIIKNASDFPNIDKSKICYFGADVRCVM